MDLSITTPALLFPAISLLMLAYTNRFLALASLIRSLHAQYKEVRNGERVIRQIKNLRRRLHLIRLMQWFGIVSFLMCVFCMFSVFARWVDLSKILFALSMIAMLVSLFLSLAEIQISTKALEIELSDVEELGSHGFIDYIKSKFDKEIRP
jgi:hypothetical protein